MTKDDALLLLGLLFKMTAQERRNLHALLSPVAATTVKKTKPRKKKQRRKQKHK